MPKTLSAAAMKMAIRVTAAGIGAAAAGPLGCALGAAFGDAFTGSFGELIHGLAEEAGKKAAEKFFDAGGDSLAEKIKGEAGGLEQAYREALRISLAELQPEVGNGYTDWFEHWDGCLKSKDALKLDTLDANQLQPTQIEAVLQATLVRIDALGALRRRGFSIDLKEREMPAALYAGLAQALPDLFNDAFLGLLASEDYQPAYRRLTLLIQKRMGQTLVRVESQTALIPQIAAELTATREEMVELRKTAAAIFEVNAQAGRVTSRELDDRDALIAQQTLQLYKLQQELAARDKEPAEARLERLVRAGDIAGAVRLKEELLQYRKSEAAKMPRDYSELGKLYELQFKWEKALEAYREAWLLEPSFDHSWQYADFARRQNHFGEAIDGYEAALRLISADPVSAAMTLNNLAILYRATQRMRESEQAFGDALAILRGLAKKNPEAYLPDVATTLNNLAVLYRATQRMRESEDSYGEALAIRRGLAKKNPEAYLPDVAMTLNNLAVLYSNTQRMREAEDAYGEALSIGRGLARENPAANLPDVASTLNNLAVLYSNTQRARKAEDAYGEALSIRRGLARENSEAYLPDVASTLNNLANVYSDTRRMWESEQAYGEALAICRGLARENPEAYLPDVARTLNNLANLYSDTQRMRESEDAYGEALAVHRGLASENPEAYLPDVATTLNNLAVFYRATQRMREAEEAYGEALAIRRGLAGENPETYLPNVARTLNNLANLYSDMQRNKEACECCEEARTILEPLWQLQPELHGDPMARILWTLAYLYGNDGRVGEACYVARRAAGMAYAPGIRSGIEECIARWCGAQAR